MISTDDRMTGGSDRLRAVLARDAALARVGRARRWAIAATAALTAGFAALVSVAAPGRSLAAKQPVRAGSGAGARKSSTSTAIPQLPPAADPSTLGLQGPDQPPQSIPSQPAQSTPSPPAQSSPSPPAQSVPAPQSSGGGGGGGVVSGGS